MSDPQTTRVFWEEQHRTGHRGNLSGSTPEEELGNLRVLPLVRPGLRVLNIGVGLGNTTAHLLESGCEVSLHDIAATALDRFAGRVAGAYLADDLPRLPSGYFDLALSHLVMQHMNDEALLPQLGHVIRSLATGGLFAFQFVVAHDQPSRSRRFAEAVERALPYCRTLGWMTDAVEAAGGATTYAELSENFPQYGFGWYVAHVTRADTLRGFRPPNARY